MMTAYRMNAHDPNYFGARKPVTDQFIVHAADERAAQEIALRIARERAGGNFCAISIVEVLAP